MHELQEAVFFSKKEPSYNQAQIFALPFACGNTEYSQIFKKSELKTALALTKTTEISA